jgi:predicted nuclease of predicted toxin-antitoxin system
VRIVADENIEKEIVDRLRADGHDVVFIAETARGIDDGAVLDRSMGARRILLTADKDFGELVFRQRLEHAGILLVRLDGVATEIKAGLVAATFHLHGDELSRGFAVLSMRALRFRRSIQ